MQVGSRPEVTWVARRPELVQACPSDQAYDACETFIEQKGWCRMVRAQS